MVDLYKLLTHVTRNAYDPCHASERSTTRTQGQTKLFVYSKKEFFPDDNIKNKNQKKWGEEKKGQCNKLKNREPNKQLTNKDNNSCD